MELLKWQEARQVLEKRLGPPDRREERALHSAAGYVLAVDAGEGEGTRKLEAGRRLGGGEILLLAEMGVPSVRTYPRPTAMVAGPKGKKPLVPACRAWLEGLGLRPGLPLEAQGKELVELAAAQAEAGADLVVLAGAEGLEPPPGVEPLFQGLDLVPGKEGAAWRAPSGCLFLVLPSDLLGAFAVLHLVAGPGLLRLQGRKGPFPLGRSPLRFSKVWPQEENRVYPGRIRVEGGESVVEHLDREGAALGRADCLFVVPAGEWIRDGDPVQWAPLGDRA